MKVFLSVLVLALVIGTLILGANLVQKNQDPQSHASEPKYTGKIECDNDRVGFYKNDPQNHPSHYYLPNNKITTAHPGDVVIAYAIWNNIGNVNLTGPIMTLAIRGARYYEVDSDGACSANSTGVYTCNNSLNSPSWQPKDGIGNAIRLKIDKNTKPNTNLYLNVQVSANEAYRNSCQQQTLTIVP